MNEVVMLHQISPVGILQELMEENIPLFLSAFCSSRWQMNRVLITNVREDAFEIKVSPRKKNQQIQLKVDQSVGISFQYEYGQDTFIFDAKILALKSTLHEDTHTDMIVLAMPEQVELVQKQNFKRVQVPSSMDIEVSLWQKNIPQAQTSETSVQVLQGFKGQLIDISANGLQVAVTRSQGPEFEKEQFMGLEFVPFANETPLKLNAYVRQIFSNADKEYILVGFQIMGLEASPEGRMVLQRICSIVDQYKQINQREQP